MSLQPQISETVAPMVDMDVIIPFPRWDQWALECVESVLQLEPPCRWVTLVPDEPLPDDVWTVIRQLPGADKVREAASGPVNPGRKRNLGMEGSDAAFFGFVDADARVRSDWLGKGMPLFAEEDVLIVGGPNVTPEEDSPWQKAYGDVMASPLGMGGAYIRHTPVPRREVAELPTCNMLVRRHPGLAFDPALDTSEDMAFCALARQLGGRVVYDPEVMVFHHRRASPSAFARQFHHYGVYQGLRMTWVSLWRAMPLGLLIYMALLPLCCILWPAEWRIFLLPLMAYGACIAYESLRLSRCSARWWRTMTGFLLAHAAYGSGYFMGLFRKAAPSGRTDENKGPNGALTKK